MNEAEIIRGSVLEFLQKHGFTLKLPLPLLDSSGLRNSIEVAERIIILYALTGLAHGADAGALKEWLTENKIYSKLLPSEQSFFAKNELSEQDIIDLSWKQESLYVLAWSGALVHQLALPYAECNLDEIFDKIPPEVEVENFLSFFTLMSEEKIFFQADVHYCLHWILRHPEVWEELEAPRQLNADVLLERRRAFEWVINSSTSWDDVVLDT